MVDQTRPAMAGSGGEATERPSRAASIGTLTCAAIVAIGVAGQLVHAEAIAWAVVSALSLAVLASIVLAHQN